MKFTDVVRRTGALVAVVSLALFAAAGFAFAQTGYQLDGVSGELTPGSTIHVHSNCWLAGNPVEVHIDSTLLGALIADAGGVVDGDFTLPANIATGPHKIILTGTDCNRVARTQTFDIDVKSKSLAFTGGDIGTSLAVGAAALLVGSTAVVGSRRRRHASLSA